MKIVAQAIKNHKYLGVLRLAPLMQGRTHPNRQTRLIDSFLTKGAAGRIASIWGSLAFSPSALLCGWVWKTAQRLLTGVHRRTSGVIGLCILTVASATMAAKAHSAADPMAPPRVVKKGEKTTNREEPYTPAPLLWTRVGAETSFAWYGGRLVQTGDAVGDARIEHIAEDYLILNRKKRRYRVPLLTVNGITVPEVNTSLRPCEGVNPCPMSDM